ncbi:FkbM family methyltransferase [Leptolyngbya sp. BL0902]|uniref:FkbM family methyltransferase n=1 Tax=Leptolyngbya sp. BL0902 TaxID=1115757 RepID=UPI0018E89463|nr:FkbM family methyltransferase [Leptolyngbya sp. BL0902]
MTETALVHQFNNGIKVYEKHLTDAQKARYQKHNLHEPLEEEIFLKIINSIPEGGCYLNIGAAIGYYALLAKQQSPSLDIHAFEPLETHRNYFRENILLNTFSEGDFHIYAEGISSSSSSQDFVESSYGSKIALGFNSTRSLTARTKLGLRRLAKRLLISLKLRKKEKTVKINTTTIDAFSEHLGKPVDLCQMDIQGLEIEALTGASQAMESGKVKVFIIGTHGLFCHQKVIEILSSFDYSIEFEDFTPSDQPDGIVVARKR